MKRIIYFIVLFPMLVIGQTQSENYIKTISYKIPDTTSINTLDVDVTKLNITYFDGLGRPIQKIANRQSASGYDIITHIEYDEFGRQVKEYLPYVSRLSNMQFDTNALDNTLNYPQYSGQNPFSQKELEASPLNRILKQAAVGNDWKMGSEHEVKYDYQLNGENEVINFKVSSSGGLIYYGYYKPNLIYKTITKNENWQETDGKNKTTQEFKDNFGRLILKRIFNNNKPHDTYYVYDAIGNLTFVLPPLFFDGFVVSNSTTPNTCNYVKTLNFTSVLSPLGDPNGTIQGGGSVKITIANGAIMLKFSGSFEPCILNENAMPIIVDDPSQCPLPDMSIGYIKFGTNANNYLVYIENNRLRIVRKVNFQDIVQITGFHEETISATIDHIYNEITVDSSMLDGLCYQYKYDEYNRLIEKKLPGKQWEYIVYNNQDKPIATGPVKNPWGADGWGWLITKYDIFGRVVYTGWYNGTSPSSENRNTFQNNLETNWAEKFIIDSPNVIDNVEVSYSNDTFPRDFKLLTVNYYDTYKHAFEPQELPNEVEGQQRLTNVKSLATGSWIRVLNDPDNTNAEVSYILYDKKSRAIRNHKTNYLGGHTIVDTKLDFIGKTMYTKTYHKRTNDSFETVVNDMFDYTVQDRLLHHKQKINSQPKELIAKYDYNELGQLMTKQVGGSDVNNYIGLQKVDYRYNIRGWLTNINDIRDLNETGAPQDLFAFKINYNTSENEDNTQVKPLYNGNIAETYWRTSTDNALRKYGYIYDDLNRLNNAIYQRPENTTPVTNMYNELIEYDKNGNITHLNRNGDLDSPNYTDILEIDNLTYSYDSEKKNQLMKVTDATNVTLGFKDDSNGTNDTADDYDYDENGNLIKDENKGIYRGDGKPAIVYNHLNLPIRIYFINGAKINYLYDALGQKVNKTVSVGATNTLTDYLDGFQYTNAMLNFFPHAEGYVNVTFCEQCEQGHQYQFNYVYNYLDYLGNVRLSYGYDPKAEHLKILEENHYYPFGLKHTNYNVDKNKYQPDEEIVGKMKIAQVNSNGQIFNKYKYNGKEYQNELGLNMYDYGARNYDPALGRWMNIDPLAETSRRFSPYTYAVDNPIFFIDPDGMEFHSADGLTNDQWVAAHGDTNKLEAFKNENKASESNKSSSISKDADEGKSDDGKSTVANSDSNSDNNGNPPKGKKKELGVLNKGLTYHEKMMRTGACESMEFSSPFFPAGVIFESLGRAMITADGFLFGSISAKLPFSIPVQRFGNMSFAKTDFWGLQVGTSSFINRTFVAIKPEFNTLTQYTTGVIQKGTPIQFGIVGPQGLAYPGGSLQFIVNSNSVINQASSVIPK